MAGETVKFTITPDGMKIDADGYVGGACMKDLDDLTKFLKENGGIGMEQTDQKKKPQAYNTSTSTVGNRWG